MRSVARIVPELIQPSGHLKKSKPTTDDQALLGRATLFEWLSPEEKLITEKGRPKVRKALPEKAKAGTETPADNGIKLKDSVSRVLNQGQSGSQSEKAQVCAI